MYLFLEKIDLFFYNYIYNVFFYCETYGTEGVVFNGFFELIWIFKFKIFFYNIDVIFNYLRNRYNFEIFFNLKIYYFKNVIIFSLECDF